MRALDVGYRLLDTAASYDNEATVGRAVRLTSVPRDEVFVTSKIPGRYQDRALALETIEESLLRMGLDYIDFYLIHWPNPGRDRYLDAWDALLEARDRGYIRHAGVSNFLPEHLDRLVAATGEAPVVNQIEMHPYFPQLEQLEVHRRMGIVTEAWTPLGRGNELLADPTIRRVAQAHGWTPAQCVLRWHEQLGAVPLPKAESVERQCENLNSIQLEPLADDELAAISALGRPDGRTTDQDPATYESL
jgi:diketogulonate reductase-like aldo/keto reductase